MYPKGRSHLVTLSTELRGEILPFGLKGEVRCVRDRHMENDGWKLACAGVHYVSTNRESFLAHIERASEFPEAATQQGTTALSQARWLRDQPYAHQAPHPLK